MLVGLVNSRIGNLQNVRKALARLHLEHVLIDRPEQLSQVEKLVLPGVGAFGPGMDALRTAGLDEAICEFARSGRGLLGICLGMQLLLTKSFEFGEHRGLGLIAGEVRSLPRNREGRLTSSHSFVPLKVPHVGWDTVIFSAPVPRLGIEVPCRADYYFTHSFAVYPQDSSVAAGVCDSGYGPFCAVLCHENIVGCQFHVELSAKAGIDILASFLRD